MAVSAMKAFVTMEGREIIIDALDRSMYSLAAPNEAHLYDIFQIKTARLGYNGDDATDVINHTATLFQADWNVTPGVNLYPYAVGNEEGFLNITHYKTGGNTIEFYVCVPPGENTDFTGANELAIYSDLDPTLVEGNEKLFIYCVFPPISKLQSDGLQFRISLAL